MFGKKSRYAATPTTTAEDRAGREVQACRLRRLADERGAPVVVKTADQLDVMAERLYRDGAAYFRVADANTELEAQELVENEGRVILVPRR